MQHFEEFIAGKGKFCGRKQLKKLRGQVGPTERFGTGTADMSDPAVVCQRLLRILQPFKV